MVIVCEFASNAFAPQRGFIDWGWGEFVSFGRYNRSKRRQRGAAGSTSALS